MQPDTAPSPSQGHREKAVFRNLAIPVSAFDHIKNTQRALEASTGQAWGLNDTVAHIVREHRKTVTHVDQHHDQARHTRTPAILR